jgi:hypothetical protein
VSVVYPVARGVAPTLVLGQRPDLTAHTALTAFPMGVHRPVPPTPVSARNRRVSDNPLLYVLPERPPGARRQAGSDPLTTRSDGDDLLTAPVSFVGVAEGLRCLVQRIGRADDRGQHAGLDEVLQVKKVLAAIDRRQGAQLLTDER